MSLARAIAQRRSLREDADRAVTCGEPAGSHTRRRAPASTASTQTSTTSTCRAGEAAGRGACVVGAFLDGMHNNLPGVDGREQAVPGTVPPAVVHQLEPVQVDEDHPDRVPAVEGGVHRGEERSPVQQTGELIVAGGVVEAGQVVAVVECELADLDELLGRVGELEVREALVLEQADERCRRSLRDRDAGDGDGADPVPQEARGGGRIERAGRDHITPTLLGWVLPRPCAQGSTAGRHRPAPPTGLDPGDRGGAVRPTVGGGVGYQLRRPTERLTTDHGPQGVREGRAGGASRRISTS
jgi:hypothetical protein